MVKRSGQYKFEKRMKELEKKKKKQEKRDKRQRKRSDEDETPEAAAERLG